MRKFFIWLLTPVARFFSGIHPNTLTIIALITGMLSGSAYWLTDKNPAFYFLGALFAAISGLCDSLDGIVARMYERCSRFGDFLDHFCDRVVDIVILTGLAFSANASSTLGLLVTIIVLLNNYLGTQIHASFGERIYDGGGKAELYSGLVVVSILLALFPDFAIDCFEKKILLINFIFVILGTVSAVNMFYRFYRVYKCYESP